MDLVEQKSPKKNQTGKMVSSFNLSIEYFNTDALRLGCIDVDVLAFKPAGGIPLSERQSCSEATVTGFFNGSQNVAITSSSFTYAPDTSNKVMNINGKLTVVATVPNSSKLFT